jgi:hypothetical protein
MASLRSFCAGIGADIAALRDRSVKTVRRSPRASRSTISAKEAMREPDSSFDPAPVATEEMSLLAPDMRQVLAQPKHCRKCLSHCCNNLRATMTNTMPRTITNVAAWTKTPTS